MQSWPPQLLTDKRVQTAFRLYSAATNTLFEQGPLKPTAPFSIAQGNAGAFWKLLKSKAVSYVMSCVAEIHFGQVRYMTLQNLWESHKGPSGQQIIAHRISASSSTQDPNEISAWLKGIALAREEEMSSFVCPTRVTGVARPIRRIGRLRATGPVS